MTGFLLSDAERQRFADWCEREAQTNQELIRFLEQQPGTYGIVQAKKAEALACRVVCKMLRDVESFSIGGSDT